MASKIDPRLRAEFKEAARSIIARDRHARKYGLSQNTIGEIERTLVQAYTLGKAHGAWPPEPDRVPNAEDPLDWILVSSRAREVLSSMTTRFSSRWGRPDGKPSKIEWFMDGGRRRWRVISTHQAGLDHSVADGSVQPLIRLGLLVSANAAEHTFELTAKGIATARAYWRRSDANDPTLPVISMR